MDESNLQRLVRYTPHDDVLDALARLRLASPTSMNAYQLVLAQLAEIEPDFSSPTTSIVVSMVRNDAGEEFGDVSGIEAGYDERVAIESVPWSEWLPATVVRGEGAASLTDSELLAYILRKMTWISFDPREIAAKRASLLMSVQRLRSEFDDAT